MKKYVPYLLIALLCIAAFWQVAFFTQTLKYDILDGYLPGHYFLSECLRNGIFPLWNPYQQLGFPIYADLSNTNYLVDIIIGRFFPYTNITFHILFILYLIIAGIGAYKLSIQLNISVKISLLTGIAYALSGFFTGNAQHIQFIIGAAWLPFSIYFFIRLSGKRRITDMLLFILTTSLLISGGYPSIAIMLAYLLVALYFYNLIILLSKKKYRPALTYTLNCLTAGLLILALSSGILISIWQSTPYVGRFVEIAYNFSVTNPFTPESMISIIAPLVPAVHPSLFHTDLSMNNHYFSVVMFIFLIYGMFNKNNLKSILLLILGFFLLFLSFGEHFFIHRIFYEYVPLFDKFRHPAAFRVFTILFFLLYSGVQVSRFDPAFKENFNRFKKIYLVLVLLILLICVVSIGKILRQILGPVDFKPTWTSLLHDYGVYGPLFIQTAIILLINSIFIYYVIIRQRNHWFYPLISGIIIAEMLIFTQLNLNYTVTSKYNPLEIREFLRSRPRGFPLPDHHLIAENTDQSVSCIPLINNTNTFAKTVSPYARYPFYLNDFYLLKNDSVIFRKAINNHLLYFDDSKGSIGKIWNDSIRCTLFSPSRMVFKTYSDTARTAVLLQNNYRGWKVTLDDSVIKHFTVYNSLIGINLNRGSHEVVYEFSNPLYIKATLFSFGLFLVLLLLFLVMKIKENEVTLRKYLYVGGFIVITLVIIFALKPPVPFYKKQKLSNVKINRFLQEISHPDDDQTFMLLNVESPQCFDSGYKAENIAYRRFRFQSEGKALWNLLDTVKTRKLIYVWSNVIELPEIQDIIKIHFPHITKQLTGKRFAVIEFTRDSAGLAPEQNYLNGYESIMTQWTSDGVIRDSIQCFSGKFSEKLTPEREFSSTFHYTLDHAPAEGTKLFAAVQFHYDGGQPFNLVITVNRKGKTAHYYAVDLRQFHTNMSGWDVGFASQQWLKSSLRKGDEIVVYCWNNGKNGSVYLDDFLVKIE